MEDQESFRDAIATVDEEGKRIWILPKKPTGKHYNYRKIVSYVLLLALFGLPFIHINGEPLVLFNVLERRFIIFGYTFYPQDFHLFALIMITAVIFVTLFTLAFGRLFCGWVCPQTIFMEMVFRRIEYLIDGDWTYQRKLRNQKWNREKILKRALKHSIFFGISFLIANCFLAYIIGVKEVYKIVTDNPTDHVGGLISMLVFSGIFYAVFAFMREQVCTVVCPYGRLQGVLLDRNSIVIAYDHIRGEKRERFHKGEDRAAKGLGDCIDCHQCVNVCPTGIDIRNGTQLECVNCTACIDACDHIMEGIGKPKGLIRYASASSIEEKRKVQFSAKRWAYTIVLLLLMIINTAVIMNRAGVEAIVLRSPGMLYEEIEPGKFANVYTVEFVNKTNEELPIELRLLNTPAELRWAGEDIVLEIGDEENGTFLIVMDKGDIHALKTDIEIGIYSNGELIEQVETTFIGPNT